MHRKRMKPFVRLIWKMTPSIDSISVDYMNLIWKRTMASQMADAELEKTTAIIQISTNKEELRASGEVLKFDGFLKVYREDRDDDEISDEENQEGMLPPLSVNQKLPFLEMLATERFSRPLPQIYRSIPG